MTNQTALVDLARTDGELIICDVRQALTRYFAHRRRPTTSHAKARQGHRAASHSRLSPLAKCAPGAERPRPPGGAPSGQNGHGDQQAPGPDRHPRRLRRPRPASPLAASHECATVKASFAPGYGLSPTRTALLPLSQAAVAALDIPPMVYWSDRHPALDLSQLRIFEWVQGWKNSVPTWTPQLINS
ncbi:hypothetical protein Arub01_02490 [Actinomadura rubrobrunea]|uniref:Uncharacterized protein n=1 Tax=Actinomadura rubrobrunea TaxID=115335 RepID=A0A9W6PP93_9ACTN|nr:hypothetical protein Arub01_02490 [Actinomadura rubrobrunea]